MKDQLTKEDCGFMILTPTPEHNGGMWCAEEYPCKRHGEWKKLKEEGRQQILNRSSNPMNDLIKEQEIKARTEIRTRIEYAIPYTTKSLSKTAYHQGLDRATESMLDFITRIRESALKEGYMDGLADGKEESCQMHHRNGWEEGREAAIREVITLAEEMKVECESPTHEMPEDPALAADQAFNAALSLLTRELKKMMKK